MTESVIQMAHGGGGGLARRLIQEEIVSRFGDGPLAELPDASRLTGSGDELIFTTDSFVVSPLAFPGGNIGSLAVHGTVNDLAVAGARAKWLSLALILEEGLPLVTLRQVLDATQAAAANCAVTVVTGDTKVVGRGQCDGLYINTAGIGTPLPGLRPDPAAVQRGDMVLCSGPLGDHGMAVLATREGINIRNGPLSDSGPVHRLILAVARSWPDIRFMRDPTRGGVAAVLNEIVDGRDVGITLRQTAVPTGAGTRAVAEMLGMDLLSVASEGRVIIICAPASADPILRTWKTLPEGRGAAVIGTVTDEAGRVTLETVAGGRRLIDVPHGELLPRIC